MPFILYCIVYCIVSYCIVMFCIVLYFIVFYCNVQDGQIKLNTYIQVPSQKGLPTTVVLFLNGSTFQKISDCI